MIDLKNGLTTKLLEIGKTSLTFSVEWKLGVKYEEDTLSLMGKLNIEEQGWNPVQILYLDPTRCRDNDWTSSFPVAFDPAQRKATFEIPYSHIMWYNDEEEKEDFEKKAFFSVRVPVLTDSPDGTTEWLYEGDYDKDETQSTVEIKKTSHLWLYAGILLGICAVFYFARRKLKTGN
jgi:hypothetical protein